MHELGIVFHIIKSIEEIGTENRLTQVASVTLELGEVSGVLQDALQDCWNWAVGRSQLLQGARLLVETVPAVTFCQSCQRTYPTVAHGRVCPLCGSERTYLKQGSEIGIKQIEAC
ncbi:hydrogenase maturation nickel metallochaperone HypA [Allofournierella sp.]|uniref:hydrogenase maturation nickel metallochaperone HypA n=1 Tax=Allofournierella sp. TaxID=1940256 RepID=UPI003AB50701